MDRLLNRDLRQDVHAAKNSAATAVPNAASNMTAKSAAIESATVLGADASLDVGDTVNLLRRLRAQSEEAAAQRQELIRANALRTKELDLAASALATARTDMGARLRRLAAAQAAAAARERAADSERAADEAAGLALRRAEEEAREAAREGIRESNAALDGAEEAFARMAPFVDLLVKQVAGKDEVEDPYEEGAHREVLSDLTAARDQLKSALAERRSCGGDGAMETEEDRGDKEAEEEIARREKEAAALEEEIAALRRELDAFTY